ncbi:Gustatory receptor 86 [Halyomorpha halys]|nr:Gustatory receptor 86 [Halyomorpha halys]
MVTIEKSFDKLFLIPKLLSIFPLKLDQSGFHRSPFSTACCTAHLLILLWSSICYVFMRPMNAVAIPLADLLLDIQQVTMVISLFLSAVCYLVSVNRLSALFLDLKEIDIILYNYLRTLDEGDSFQSTYFFGFSVLVVFVMDLLSFQDDVYSTILLYWTFFLTLTIMYYFVEIMDIFLLRFKILNQRVMHFNLSSLSNLIGLTKICNRLSECVLKANGIYSLPLLCYFSYFVGLAANCFFFVYTSSSNIYRYLCMYFVLVSWVILLLFKFYSILTRNHYVMIEIKEFNSRLYQLMLYDQTDYLCNDLQIASKRDISFTVAGFFKLDLTLLILWQSTISTVLSKLMLPPC